MAASKMPELLIGQWKDNLLPRIHITEDLSEAKDYHRIVMLSFLGDHISQSFIESSSFFSHSSIGRKNQGCENSMLHFLTVFSLLGLLMSSVGINGTITGCVRVKKNKRKKKRTSKNASCGPFQKPLAWMSNRALLLVFAECAARVSQVRGCRGGSIATL